MKKLLSVLISVALLLSFCLPLAATALSAASDTGGLYRGVLKNKTYWIPTVDGNRYQLYRLPGIVVTAKDTVIVYGEARRTEINQDGSGTTNDECEMDLYVRRSTDGGETFGEHIWIAKGAEYYANGYGETIDNPVMIVGNNGRLHLLFCCNAGKSGHFYCYSEDDGVTWSTPRDISADFGDFSFQMMAFGPGHGICKEDGTLIVSAWVYNGTYRVYTVYSTDNGTTWKIGQKVSENRDETCLVGLSGGAVLMNSRQHTLPSETSPYRRLSWSLTGISDWSSSKANETLIDPACAGGMCSVDLEGLPYAVLFTNNASRTKRDHLTVRCSFDDGQTWEKSLLIDELAGGYSDIAVDSKGKVYVIYEKAMGSRVHLATFSFYDAFCKNDDSVLSDVTRVTELTDAVTDAVGLDTTADENGTLCITAGGEEPSLVLDISSRTKAVNVSELPVIALRVRGSASNQTATCGLYVRCGIYGMSSSKLYASFSVPNDGKEHTILVDLRGRAAYGGNLYSVELNFFTAGKPAVAGEQYSVSEIAFFANAEEAAAAYPPEQQETNAPAGSDPAPAQTDPATAPDAGCASAVGMPGAAIAALVVVLPVWFGMNRKKKKEKQI